jgi:tetraacyldisaccharide 4'-kinase
MSSARLQRAVERLWYGGSPAALLLQPLAWAFGAAVALRRGLYSAGVLRVRRSTVPVIVVGNVTVGGTGKTPLVAWLAARLRAAGHRPAIVSRGYGVAGGDAPVAVTAASDAAAVGDEPVLLARRSGCPVVVDRDRPRAVARAAADGADVVIADDGLQHYALARDLEIAVVDGERGLGNGRLLPAGPLREPASRLDGVTLVLRNGGPAAASRFVLRATEAVRLADGARRPLSAFAGARAWAVAGIGNPGRFAAELARHGVEPVLVAVPDHGRVDLAALERGSARAVLMTEKDAVKYPDCRDPSAWYVPVEVEMPAETEAEVMAAVGTVLRAPGSAGRG